MAVFEGKSGNVTTEFTAGATAGYESGDGDGDTLGAITLEDIAGYKIFKIGVSGNDVSIVITGANDNGTVLRPWANGVSLNADAAGAVSLIIPSPDTDDYSYVVTNAGLATAMASDITALVATSL